MTGSHPPTHALEAAGVVLETERLILRRFTPDDTEFVVELLNDPAFLQHIGDKGVRSREEALGYIRGITDDYAALGYGRYLVARRDDGVSMGLCGLIQRDTLTDVDIGFAFLPQFGGEGYAYEAASATLTYARGPLGLARIVAVVAPDNVRSKRLLGKVGLRFECLIQLAADDIELELHGIGVSAISAS